MIQPSKLLFEPFAHSLKTFFLIFPVLVFGNSLTTSTSLGTINLLILLFFLAHVIKSSPFNSLPGCIVTKAFGLSPHCSSWTATTPASSMSGCVTSIDSRAREEIFSPPYFESATELRKDCGLTTDDDILGPVQYLSRPIGMHHR